MRILKLLFKRETFLPMAALTFASVVSASLILSRVIITGNLRYSFLVWNLLLAWMPVVFAMLAREDCRGRRVGERAGWKFFSLCGAWLLFFPNAPYIFTDLIHLTNRYISHFWVDLAVILSCAFTGLVLGFLSLYLMQSLVSQRYGNLAGWGFAACVAGVSSFGIYLGRFLRFNSWDVIAKPVELYQGISSAASAQFSDARHFAFFAFYATFIFIAYVMLYAMAHLPTAMQLQRETKRGASATLPGETFGAVLPAMKTRSELPLTASTAFQDS
jgi:uncharacterized membrane protein